MNRLRLDALTMTGPSLEPASVHFGDGLTVIYGASETGKTFIARSIDFMLGAKRLRLIREASGYTDVFLSFAESEDVSWTLGRRVGGTPFLRWPGVQPLPPTAAFSRMAVSNKSESSASKFWLKAMGLADAGVVLNEAGESRAVSIRDIAHLCIIDETDIQAERSPVLSEQATSWPPDKNNFRQLVDGTFAPAPAGKFPTAAKRNASAGKAELLEKLIRDLEDDPASQATLENLEARLDLVTEAIQQAGQALEEVSAERAELIRSSAELQHSVSELERDGLEASELFHRFQLLSAKYQSDLDRLAMIREAGSLLGYLHHGPCPFCGTALVDQPGSDLHVELEATDLAISIAAERSKTQALLDDLRLTIAGVDGRRDRLRSEVASMVADREEVQRRIAVLDAQLQPATSDLAELLEARSGLERGIAIKQRIEEYEDLRTQFLETPSSPSPGSTPAKQTSEGLAAFCRTVADLLGRWQVPGAVDVRFDLNDYEVLVGGQARGARGKGMRSIIHAAFTVGLAVHCIERDLPHPGFIVLDSPLVTYRGPAEERSGEDLAAEALPMSAADSFFTYLARDFPGQAIVLENTDPPPDLLKEITAFRFTKSSAGRYGFIPQATR